jgi:hypothetical protein
MFLVVPLEDNKIIKLGTKTDLKTVCDEPRRSLCILLRNHIILDFHVCAEFRSNIHKKTEGKIEFECM